jgi:hypothetical protein
VKVLRQYATSQMVAGSRPDLVNEFVKFISSFRPHWALRFTQPLTETSSRSRGIMFLEIEARPVRGTENFTAICEPIV